MNGSSKVYTVRAWIAGAEEDAAVLKDVVFGDVFVCGGQSNMVFGLSMMINGSAAVQDAGR